MAHHGPADATAQSAAGLAGTFVSLLSAEPGGPGQQAGPGDGAGSAGPDVITDLLLDQVISAVAGGQEERELVARLVSLQVRDIDTLRYRHEVFRDLDDAVLVEAARSAP
jgi:hypothetical protein